MAYCIFLKSLRILEEFMKNPCVRIPPKSPCENFQILGKLKNPILFQKEFLFSSGPVGPAGRFGLLAQWPSAQPIERPACRAGPPAADPFPPPFSNPSRRSHHRRPSAPPAPCAPPLSPTGIMEPQRPALPPLNSTPH
jgi:hypothetical protein